MPSWIEVSQVDYYKMESRAEDADELRTENRRLRSRIFELEAEQLDVQRNEERADAEIGELTMKLHTLEAAVRAYRDDPCDDRVGSVDNLYALVPEGK